MVWKKKTNIFHDQMEPKLAERRLKMLKAFLLVAGISFVVFIVGVVVHNVLYALSEIEEPVFFSIAIFSLVLFTIATIGSLVIFLQGRRKQDKEIPN
jgi:polyferredoxin